MVIDAGILIFLNEVKTKEVIRDITKYRGHTNESLYQDMGYTTSSGIGNIIARDEGISVDKLIKIMRVLDCEAIIHSKFVEDEDMEWKL